MPGESMELREEFRFFFHHRDDTYSSPPVADVRALLEEQVWKIPPGMILANPEVEVDSTPISWQEDNKKYTVDGYRVTITGSLSIAEDHQPSEDVLAVTFPGLVEALHAGQATPRIDGETDLLTDTNALEVQKVKIHESQLGSLYSAYGAAVLAPLSVVALLFIVVRFWLMLQGAPAEGLA